MSVVTRVLETLGQNQAALEAEDLAQECGRPGCTRIAALQPRQVAEVTGAVHSLAVQPRDRTPALQVELYDGTGVLRLLWLGRRAITGIRPGVFLTVRGRITEVDGVPAMYNPAYELLPDDDA
ncbi:OB-fold nucleic acid binding domain-containing protein [Ornithinicoccus halotolerans]|uniref:OB-fold nucleic acid binding domain-containing protein n=1 Tax=Ornithinicoccus halotolerans TaxID=1748220 RepID=UPI0012972C37|nr:OB-fold nucleic acid binding domain-containing protein [Ornithinicoccus halotolerans]